MKRLIRFVILFFIPVISFSAFPEDLASKTRELDGTSITYNYTSGRSYKVVFEQDGISYQYLTGSKPDKWWGPFPYTAFQVDEDVFLASWYEEGYGDYVTLLIDFRSRLLYGSAIISGSEVHFHGAKIVDVENR